MYYYGRRRFNFPLSCSTKKNNWHLKRKVCAHNDAAGLGTYRLWPLKTLLQNMRDRYNNNKDNKGTFLRVNNCEHAHLLFVTQMTDTWMRCEWSEDRQKNIGNNTNLNILKIVQTGNDSTEFRHKINIIVKNARGRYLCLPNHDYH